MNSIFILGAFLAIFARADNWAVLVAGSYQFYNYRHQADVCHAYQTLIKNGYNPDHIITLAYDDIANHRQNKFPGQIYNSPTYEGFSQNVYDGCVIDYTKKQVTPQNFIYVLQGRADLVPPGLKVLNTTEADNIFIYFSDHGSPGLLAFPTSYLYESDLTPVFEQMAQDRRFNKLIFYLEACESGSMFVNLRKDLNIYAISAADPTESSWGTYCPPDDVVNGFSLGTCLGDEFSVAFLELTDNAEKDMSLQEHFETIRELTKGSHVLQWGDLSYTSETIGKYLWGDSVESVSKGEELKVVSDRPVSKWDSRDNKLLYLQNKYKETGSEEDLKELVAEEESRQYFDNIFGKLKSTMKLQGNYHFAFNQRCLKSTIEIFERLCTPLSDYGLKYVSYLSEMCDHSNLMQVQLDMGIVRLCQQN